MTDETTASATPKYKQGDVVAGHRLDVDDAGQATWVPLNPPQAYVVLQVVLYEKFFGTGSGNLPLLEAAINTQAARGYRLHTISTTSGGSKGFGGGDRIQATMVFERIA